MRSKNPIIPYYNNIQNFFMGVLIRSSVNLEHAFPWVDKLKSLAFFLPNIFLCSIQICLYLYVKHVLLELKVSIKSKDYLLAD